MPERSLTLTLTIEVDVSVWDATSDLTDQQIADAVWAKVKPERDELAAEARIEAMRLLGGLPPEAEE